MSDPAFIRLSTPRSSVVSVLLHVCVQDLHTCMERYSLGLRITAQAAFDHKLMQPARGIISGLHEQRSNVLRSICFDDGESVMIDNTNALTPGQPPATSLRLAGWSADAILCIVAHQEGRVGGDYVGTSRRREGTQSMGRARRCALTRCCLTLRMCVVKKWPMPSSRVC